MSTPTRKLKRAATVAANRALITDASGNATTGTTTDTEIGYLAGVTSAVQTQLNAKLAAASNLSDLANAGTARTNLGATTVGANVFTTANPSAVRFFKINADNTIALRTAAEMLSDIGGEAFSLMAESTSTPTAASASGTNSLAIGNSAISSRRNEVNLLGCTKSVSVDLRAPVFAFNGETIDASQTSLFLDGASARLTLGDYCAVAFKATFIGRRTDEPGDIAVVKLSGAAAREETAASTRIIGTINNDGEWLSTGAQVESASIKLRVDNAMAAGADFKICRGATWTGVALHTVVAGATGEFCLPRSGQYSCFIDTGGGGAQWDAFATLASGTQYGIELDSANDPRIGGFVVPVASSEAATITCASGSIAAWAVTIEADTTNGALVPKVTGESGKDIDWLCVMRLEEIYV